MTQEIMYMTAGSRKHCPVKKMQKRRNHFHAFLKQYEGRFVYRQLDESTREDVYAFLRYWQSFKDVDDSISAEDTGIHLCWSI